MFSRFGVRFLTFEGLDFLRLRISNSYVWGLVFLRLRISNFYVWGLDFLRLGFRNSCV